MSQIKGNELSEEHSRKVRHHSDDVRSLDSWSELTPEYTRKNTFEFDDKGKRKVNKDLVSNHSILNSIEEPPEPKITRIKLHKAVTSREDLPRENGRGYQFVRVLENEMEHLKDDTHKLHKQHKQKNKCKENTNLSSDVCEQCNHSNLSESNEKMRLKSKDRHQAVNSSINLCSCNHCEDVCYRDSDSDDKTADFRNGRLKSSHHSDLKHLKPNHSGFNPLGVRQNIHRRLGSNFGHDGDQIDQSDKMKNKLLSVWNNVKYGWTLKSKASFQEDSPIFLLGCCYHKRPEDDDPEPGQVFHTPPSMELFKQDFQSRLWFTYRRDFQALPQTRITTDCGWGCMLRSSQMILAQALLCHFLGRDWRVHNQNKEQETFYRHTIQWFGDSMSDQCPFSVHRLAEIGKNFGKQPGDWYGPSSVAFILRDALNKAALSQPILKDLCVYVAQDCTVYKQDILELCTARPRNFTNSSDSMKDGKSLGSTSMQTASSPNDSEWKRSVIIFVPVRLGGEEFNPIYSACIKNLMAQDLCLGIIGGKPKHSLYFVGWQGDKLIHLDPHFCQDYVDTMKRDFKIESYHCFTPRKISITKMDPSATIGFYCRTRADFDRFVEQTEQMVTPKKGSGPYPMFVFSEGKGSQMDISDLSLSLEKSVRIAHVKVDEHGKIRSSTVDSEEFIVL